MNSLYILLPLFWNLIKSDLKRMLCYSHHSLKLERNTNSSFLALIPKEINPTSFTRFQPISLCNYSYKILTKIIASRLKKILPKIISPNQEGFIHDRQIMDNIVLVPEAIHSSVKPKCKGMVIKLDMANAFDCVRHEFLFQVMEQFGFSSNFKKWVAARINNPWIAPLVNGRPTDFFQISKGLRPGRSLSPVLFIILAEALSRKLEYERESGNLPRLQIASGVKNMNYSQFVEDTLLSGGASIIFATKFKSIMDSFINASGGDVNNRKCQVMGWSTPSWVMQAIAQVFQFSLAENWTSFRYLGIPISLQTTSAQVWQQIIEKMNRKLMHWGSQWLNLASRVILIKAVLLLTALPLYQCSALLAPKGIVKQITMKIRSFLWKGGKSKHKKFHLVNWKQVTSAKNKGGLGIHEEF
jgi:hypothetical protein